MMLLTGIIRRFRNATRRAALRCVLAMAEWHRKAGHKEQAKRLLLRAHVLKHGRQYAQQVPDVVSIETIMGCNAACVMCPYPSSKRTKGLMKEDLFHKLVDQLMEFPKRSRISLQFLGEPLMDKKLESRVAYLTERGFDKIEIATNASLLTPARIQSLLESNLTLINVDLESLNKDVYEAIRVGLKHDVVMRNILELFKTRDQMNSQTAISILFIQGETNKEEVTDFVNFFSDIIRPDKGDFIRIFPVHNFGGYGETKITPTRQPCYSLYTSFNVLNNGHSPLCCVDQDGDTLMGDVNEKSALEIFNDTAFVNMRRLHEMGARDLIEKCNSCNLPEIVSHQVVYGAGGLPFPEPDQTAREHQ